MNIFWEAYFNPYHRLAITDEFEVLHQEDMAVTEYYNQFMKLSQHCLTGLLALFSKFMSRLRLAIIDKITEHQFYTLMDC